ncbi:MAG: hypothetical protein IPK11_16185 [Ignavibacteria bacterium]|nr:hypothetical protein [Ignavibacteria bacterium]
MQTQFVNEVIEQIRRCTPLAACVYGWNPPPDVPPNGGTSLVLTQNVVDFLKTTKVCVSIQI